MTVSERRVEFFVYQFIVVSLGVRLMAIQASSAFLVPEIETIYEANIASA